MEEPLDKVLAGLLLKSNTTGAMVVDKNGLCLALKGTASEKAAGESDVVLVLVRGTSSGKPKKVTPSCLPSVPSSWEMEAAACASRQTLGPSCSKRMAAT